MAFPCVVMVLCQDGCWTCLSPSSTVDIVASTSPNLCSIPGKLKISWRL